MHCVYAASLRIYSRYIQVTFMLYEHRKYTFFIWTICRQVLLCNIIYTACHMQLCYLLRYDIYCALCIEPYCITQNLLTLGVAFLRARHMNLHYVYMYREGYGYRHNSTYTGHFILVYSPMDLLPLCA